MMGNDARSRWPAKHCRRAECSWLKWCFIEMKGWAVGSLAIAADGRKRKHGAGRCACVPRPRLALLDCRRQELFMRVAGTWELGWIRFRCSIYTSFKVGYIRFFLNVPSGLVMVVRGLLL